MNLESFSHSFFQPLRFGVIEVSGADATRFLHRMSTNNVEALAIGSSCLTAFVNQKARLVAATYVVRQSENICHLIVPYDDATKLATWLDQYLFVEEVTLTNVTDAFSLFWIIGERQGIAGPDFHLNDLVVPSSLRLCDRAQEIFLRSKLESSGFMCLGEPEFESVRIAGGVSLSNNEINESHQPIQLGLQDAIHWAKGCYIGQEVISRLESKDKAAKTLIAIKVSEVDWSRLKKGEGIRCNDEFAGTLTSVAPLYLTGQANALAVLKRPRTTSMIQTDLSKVRIDSTKQDH